MSAPTHLEVGYVARAHGLKGEVAVRTFDPDSTVFEQVRRVLVRPRQGPERTLVVEAVRPTPRELLVTLAGVRGREQGEALVGATVLAFREDLPPPAEGEFFQGDLVGLAAFDEQGEALGVVEELWTHGEVPNLVIRAPGREELVVPFADEFVPGVDLAARRLTVRPPRFLEDAEGEGPDAP